MVTNILGFDSPTGFNECRYSEIKNQRKMKNSKMEFVKVLVNKRTDAIIGKIEKELHGWHGCQNVFLLAGKSNFVTAGNDFEVRKFKARTK